MTTIRPPAVAGSFYPDDPAILSAVVEDFLAEVPGPPGDGPLDDHWPKAVIAPHAGYIYSGPVAASAYARLKRAAGRVRRVVVIGPSHYAAFPGIAAPAAEAFETPLGRVPVDAAAIAEIRDLPQVAIADGPHIQEHSLEVQLPFLQAVLGDFAVVPLAIGEAGPAQTAEVLARLWGGTETAIVVSYRSLPLQRTRDRPAPGRGHGGGDRGLPGRAPGPARRLRLPGPGRLAGRGQGARARHRAPRSAQLGRDRRPHARGGRLRRLGAARGGVSAGVQAPGAGASAGPGSGASG